MCRKPTLLKRNNATADAISISDLTVKTGENTTLLSQYQAQFPQGKTTLLRGPSGAGKTTVLRVMNGTLPFSQGVISGLPQNTVFVPSKPYFPFHQSLIQCLMYPDTQPPSQEQRANIHTLMKELNMSRKIPLLDKKRDWEKLSDGEKQRCMIICAILKKPECLVMDEATSRVDHTEGTNTKKRIEDCLKKHLPNTTIIFTDHNPSDTFHDNIVEMQPPNPPEKMIKKKN